ncbi:ABC transporter substrate-binding protein [Roseibium sp. RKSG952]|uniref:ABC transporter substrate-binding protein n=1 Tax=Roseibium sp. RKSG952 TaxID=2529384 RepID=UPI0012BD1551|nr:ABC transporter substrate-binding protein [Roseibium sp. RKSG952]MTH95567.1 ABC transporter substrate-binding protein [Roseibium sp. RKSG952]
MGKELEFLADMAVKGKMHRRDFLGRASAFGLTAAMAGTMLSTRVQATGPVSGGTMKIGIQGGASTDSLDPATASNSTATQILRMWGEPLVELNEEGGLDPVLAEAYSASTDAKTWTFKIRPGVTFSDGKSLTADDVQATFERHTGADTKSGALGVLRGISDIRTNGDSVVFTLDAANADLPYLLADYHLMIQPNGGKDAPAAAIGTGPYVIKAHEPGVRTVFEKNPNHWRSGWGHAGTIELYVINDDTARMSALQSGVVDIVNRVPPKLASLIGRAPNVTVHSVPSAGHYTFIMHVDTAPFDNKDLRLALKYGVDRQEMVDKILFGNGSIGNDTPINSTYPLYSDDIEQRQYDPDKAAFHYKASGHEGAVLLRTSENSFPGAPDASQIFQQNLAKAGIQLDLAMMPDDGYWSEVWNKQPFCTSYWGGRPVQDAMFATAYLSTADWNDTRFFNEQFDQLLFAARAELDEAKRKQMYRDMSVILRDDGGLICPMFNNFIDATSDRIAGWGPSQGFGMMNHYAPMKMWVAS